MKRLLPMTLFALALGLAAATAYELAAPSGDVVTDVLPARVRFPAPVAISAYSPPATEQFAALDSRPPFNPTRTPLPDIVPAADGATAASDFTLVGVIMDGSRAIALLHSKSTSSTTGASVGDLVNGWRVSRIEATAVTLRGSGGDFVVALATPGSQLPSAPLPPLSSAPASTAPMQPVAAPSPTPPSAQRTVPATVATAVAPQPPPSKPALPAKKSNGTIASDALRGAPIDPTTGEPTL